MSKYEKTGEFKNSIRNMDVTDIENIRDSIYNILGNYEILKSIMGTSKLKANPSDILYMPLYSLNMTLGLGLSLSRIQNVTRHAYSLDTDFREYKLQVCDADDDFLLEILEETKKGLEEALPDLIYFVRTINSEIEERELTK